MNEVLGPMAILAQAGPVVKMVLFILLSFSIVSWAIIFSKRSLLKKSEKDNRDFWNIYHKAPSFKVVRDDTRDFSRTSLKAVFEEGHKELSLIQEKSQDSVKNCDDDFLRKYFESFGMSCLERALDKGIASVQQHLEKRMSFLASIGSSSPFIGLFGTVWGIMNSFTGLAKGGGTIENIAPGIAEALVATAIGLAVAIPAVLFYNHYSNKIFSIAQDMENFKRDFINKTERVII